MNGTRSRDPNVKVHVSLSNSCNKVDILPFSFGPRPAGNVKMVILSITCKNRQLEKKAKQPPPITGVHLQRVSGASTHDRVWSEGRKVRRGK